MDNFWIWIWVAAWVTGIIVWGMTLYLMTNFMTKRVEKKGEDEFPHQAVYNVPIELSLTTLSTLIVITLFFFTIQTQDRMTAPDKDLKTTVDVTGFQWDWEFGCVSISADLVDGQGCNGRVGGPRDEQFSTGGGHYAPSKEDRDTQKQHSVHGNSKSDDSYLHYDEIEALGITEEVPALAAPGDTAIQFDLASADVIHSFRVPKFLFKRDAFPYPEANKSNRISQIEKIDPEKMASHLEGNSSDKMKSIFVDHYAEACSTYHAMMNFGIRAISREAFTEYIKFCQADPEATSADTLKYTGEPALAVSTSPFNLGRVDTRDTGDYGANTIDLSAIVK